MAVSSNSLAGKTALVTGGSRNIGRAIALNLAAGQDNLGQRIASAQHIKDVA